MRYFLEFAIDRRKFAVPIEEVVEVARPGPIRPRAGRKKNIIGSFTLRRENISVVDLALVLKMKGQEQYEVMIAEIAGRRIGFRVDKVLGIIEHDVLKPVPDMVKSHRSLTGMIMRDDTVIPVVSLEKAVPRASPSAIRNKARTKSK